MDTLAADTNRSGRPNPLPISNTTQGQAPEKTESAVTGNEKTTAEPQHAGDEPIPSPTSNDVVPTTKLQFLVIFIALILAIFCVALDNTIIVTAIPRITDDYKTLNDVGWSHFPCAAMSSPH